METTEIRIPIAPPPASASFAAGAALIKEKFLAEMPLQLIAVAMTMEMTLAQTAASLLAMANDDELQLEDGDDAVMARVPKEHVDDLVAPTTAEILDIIDDMVSGKPIELPPVVEAMYPALEPTINMGISFLCMYGQDVAKQAVTSAKALLTPAAADAVA